MATATKPSKTQLVVWDLAVGEVPVMTSYHTRITVYVQRVGDELRFYKAHISDTDVVRTGEVAEWVVKARTFAAVVERLSEANSSERILEPDEKRTKKTARTERRWSFSKGPRSMCTFRARCGEAYTVKLAVMEQIVQEFGAT